MKYSKSIMIAVALVFLATSAGASDKPVIGVTLHPYYSFVANIVGDEAIVEPLLKAGFNPHNYRPQPDDIKRVMDMDVLVVNGIGHDEFAFEIVDAAGMKNKLRLIYANRGVALIPVAGTERRIVNPHTFISINASIQQIYNISDELCGLYPEKAKVFKKNTRIYVNRLRRIKAGYLKKIPEDADLRCATIHGAYGYMLQEFGLSVTAVIEPRHGLKPTASQLADTIDRIRQLDVDVIFSEMDFPDKYVEAIQKATNVNLYSFSHITSGEYTNDKFENEMSRNMETLTNAVLRGSK